MLTKDQLGKKTSIVSGIASVIVFILVIFLVIGSQDRIEESQQDLEAARAEMNRIVNKAIVHCETDGLACNEIVPQWLEECKKPEMNKVSSCHDGRLEQLMDSRVVKMSQECHLRLAMIQKYVITDEILVEHGPNYYDSERNEAISYFEELCGDYETLKHNFNVISDECKELKEIMEQNRWGVNNNDPLAITEFGLAMNEYNKLGCS